MSINKYEFGQDCNGNLPPAQKTKFSELETLQYFTEEYDEPWAFVRIENEDSNFRVLDIDEWREIYNSRINKAHEYQGKYSIRTIDFTQTQTERRSK